MCNMLEINVRGRAGMSKTETSVLSVELRGRLIVNDLRLK